MLRLAACVLLLGVGGCVLPRPIQHEPLRPEEEPVATRSSERATGRATRPSAWQTFGFSVEGRPLLVRHIGGGPRRVLWVGGIHGNEREGSVATDALPGAFAAQGLGDRVTLSIVEDVNPDGSAAGTRGNANGVDLNRNFPASNFRSSRTTGRQPLDQPEAKALHQLILDLAPDLVIVAHSARRGRFINWDGAAEADARRFAEASGFPLVASEQLHGTPGSLGSWLGRDRGVGILTLEFRNGERPEDGWVDTRDAILQAIEGR